MSEHLTDVDHLPSKGACTDCLSAEARDGKIIHKVGCSHVEIVREHLPSKDLIAGLQKIRRRVSGELDGTWMLHSEAVAVLAEIERLQGVEVKLGHDLAEARGGGTSQPPKERDILAELRALPGGYRLLGYTAAEEIETLRQELRAAQDYAREVEDEYRKRTGHGFGDGAAARLALGEKS